MDGAQKIERLVARPVIDEDDFKTSCRTLQNRKKPLQERPYILGFVQDRDNDAQFGLPVLAAIEHARHPP
jgi:hypothetical protein